MITSAFLDTLVKESAEEIAFEEAISLLSFSELEKVAAPLGFGGKMVGKAMHLHSVAPLKSIGTAAGAAYGGLSDPGIDPQTGQPRGRLGNMVAGAAGGLALGAGAQAAGNAVRGLKGPTGDFVRKAQGVAARASTNNADRELSRKALNAGAKNAGTQAPRVPVRGSAPAKGQNTAVSTQKPAVAAPTQTAPAQAPQPQATTAPAVQPQGPVASQYSSGPSGSNLVASAAKANAAKAPAVQAPAIAAAQPQAPRSPFEGMKIPGRDLPAATPAPYVDPAFKHVKASVDLAKVAAPAPNMLSQAAKYVSGHATNAANYIHSAGTGGAAVGGAALGAAKNLVNPGTDPQTGQQRSTLGAMAGGAIKGGLAGAALHQGIKHYQPAISGKTTFSKNTSNLYDAAKKHVDSLAGDAPAVAKKVSKKKPKVSVSDG